MNIEVDLTPEQVLEFKEAIGDGSYWPKATSDPRVNWAIDCFVSASLGEPDDEWDEVLYIKEVKLMAVL